VVHGSGIVILSLSAAKAKDLLTEG